MQATIVDLRYRMNDVLKALERNEEVYILYRGKVKGILKPSREKEPGSIRQDSFFSMSSSPKKEVLEEMKDLRGGRYRDDF